MTLRSWSNSKLRLRKICGWAFDREILAGQKREPNPALVGGSEAHDALQLFVHAVLNHGVLDDFAIANRAGSGSAQSIANLLPILEVMEESLLEDEPPIHPRQVIMVEKRLSMNVPGDVGVFDGKPDLVSALRKRCTIEDWKTHWRPLSQEAFEADHQLKRYALLVAENHEGFEEFRLRMRFVRYRGAVRETTLTLADLDVVRWQLYGAIEEAEADDQYDATPGDWCNLCGHTTHCPVFREFLEDGVQLAIANDDDATRAAEMVRVIDAHSMTLKRKLKGYLGGDHPTGRVPLSGGSYGYGLQRKKRAAVEDVLEIWKEFERPQNMNVLRVDIDELKRSLDREPGLLRAAMDAAIEEFEVPHFRYRRGDERIEEEESEEA